MKKALYALLAPFTLFADPSCCTAAVDCYPCMVNPPPISRETCAWGGHFDFLYWQLSEEENPFAYVVTNSPFAPTPFTGTDFSIYTKEYAYDYRAGYRIGFNAGLPCDEWNISLDWTHFLHDNRGSTSISGPATVAFSSYLNIGYFILHDNGITFADSEVNSLLRTQLNVIDLLINRQFYVGQKVTFCPYGGLRGFFLKQKVEATNRISGAHLGLTYTTSDADLKASTDFKGVGLIGGFLTKWDFFCQFSLYTNMAGSVFYGKNRSSLQGQLTNTGLTIGDALTFIQANFSHELNCVKYALDFAIGFEWESSSLSNGSVVGLRAGWEEHLYFNQNTLMNLTEDQIFVGGGPIKPNSNIAFQGLAISLTYTY